MNVEEFLKGEEQEDAGAMEEGDVEELSVQKAVVEELAADKAKLDEQIVELRGKISSLEGELAKCMARNAELASANGVLGRELEASKEVVRGCKAMIAELKEREFDVQERNPNALALLDRDVELPDRFPGETRDHVIEVLREARDRAEEEGRIRRAQILESVLVANEPHGNLASKRSELEKLFNDNGNILSGPVIEALEKLGISYKNGEEYLLASEIIKRTY